VAGSSYTTDGSGSQHATLWNDGTFTDLGEGIAYAINDAGLVVGSSNTGDAGSHATLWDGATTIDLNSFLDAGTLSAGWELVEARDINDNGWIVGAAYNANLNVIHAFLLTPTAVPVPNALWLFGSGFFGLIGIARRKVVC